MKIMSGLKSAFVNSALHIVFYHPQREREREEILIFAVDCNWNKHRIIRWPGEHKSSVASFVGYSRGRLHCISGHLQQEGQGRNCYITELSIWVLEDYDKEDWIVKHTVSCMQLFGKVSCQQEEFDVVTIHPDCNLVFFVQDWDQKLISYDIDSNQVRTLHTLVPKYGSVTPYSPYFAELLTLTKKP
ncbi:hypothetical protein QOZ80_7AG0558830 [Eleusine coracana subsp. coracana]|nr:hypothetical protein QOZ80_7AG0558830 [Eleusine coracana subsp. coracana]